MNNIRKALEGVAPFSEKWHELLRLLLPFLSRLEPESLPPCMAAFLPQLRALADSYDPSGWEAHIDRLDLEALAGWAKKEDSDSSPLISVFVNNQEVLSETIADGLREDVRRAGHGSGRYGYAIASNAIDFDNPVLLCRIVDPATGAIVAFRFFYLPDALSENELLALARSLRDSGKSAPARALAKAGFGKYPQNFAFAAIAADCGRADRYEKALSSHIYEPLARGDYSESLARALEADWRPVALGDKLLLAGMGAALASNGGAIERLIASSLADAVGGDPDFRAGGDRIGFIIRSADWLAYLLPILKALRYPVFDVISPVWDQKTRDILDRNGLAKIRVFTGLNNIRKYKTIFIDRSLLWVKEYQRAIPHETRVVTYTHSLALPPLRSHREDLAIFPYSSHLRGQERFSAETKALPPDKTEKYEAAYSGPFQFEREIIKGEPRKSEARRLLAEAAGANLDAGKPFILFVEGGFSSPRQIVYCLNRLARDCVIMFKPYLPNGYDQYGGLGENILRFPDDPSLLVTAKLAADFIMAEFYKGTFLSSIVLGLPVIPFYSRPLCGIIGKRGLTSQKRFEYINGIDNYPYRFLYQNFRRVFDLINIGELKKAIFEPEYLAWYRQNLPLLQKGAFGDYFLEEAAEKTAEYILRFAKVGTLGKDGLALSRPKGAR